MSQQVDHSEAKQGQSCQPVQENWMLSTSISINGHGPYSMSIDTGAGLTVIIPELAEKLGLEIVDTEERHGVGGAISIDIASIQSISAGGIDVALETVGVSTFPKLLCGDAHQGSLGFDVLRHGRLTADFAHSHVVFEPSLDAAIEGIPFVIASKKKPLISVKTTVNGVGPHWFAVDTGAMGTCIAPELAEQIEAEKGLAVQAAGVGGMMDAYFTAQPVTFHLGENNVGEVTPVVLDIFSRLAPETGLNIAGIIGRDIMKQYVVTVDYPNSVISFATP